MNPKYLNDLLPLISMLCSNVMFCKSLPTFKYNVLRMFTFKPDLWNSTINFCHIFFLSLSCFRITWSSANRRRYIMLVCLAMLYSSKHFKYKILKRQHCRNRLPIETWNIQSSNQVFTTQQTFRYHAKYSSSKKE